jgi:hypothetical protein
MGMYICMYVCVFVCVYIYIHAYIEFQVVCALAPRDKEEGDVVIDTHVFLFPHIPEQWFLLLYCISQRKGAIRQKTRDRG